LPTLIIPFIFKCWKTQRGGTSNLNTVNPHVCGELSSLANCSISSFGSSPPEWGTPVADGKHPLGLRFIPTRVGNSRWFRCSWFHFSVHPHASGELVDALMNCTVESGSSPHEWGTRGGRHCCRHCWRFIPTRVGNSHMTTTTLQPRTVHPHSHGNTILHLIACVNNSVHFQVREIRR